MIFCFPTCVVSEVINVSSVQTRIDRAPPPSSRQLKWFDEQVMHPHEPGCGEDFSLCNFVDASIVGCV